MQNGCWFLLSSEKRVLIGKDGPEVTDQDFTHVVDVLKRLVGGDTEAFMEHFNALPEYLKVFLVNGVSIGFYGDDRIDYHYRLFLQEDWEECTGLYNCLRDYFFWTSELDHVALDIIPGYTRDIYVNDYYATDNNPMVTAIIYCDVPMIKKCLEGGVPIPRGTSGWDREKIMEHYDGPLEENEVERVCTEMISRKKTYNNRANVMNLCVGNKLPKHLLYEVLTTLVDKSEVALIKW